MIKRVLNSLTANGVLGLWSVRFSDATSEQAFKAYSLKRNGPTDRFILVSGIGIYLAYSILDTISLGSLGSEMVIVRLLSVLLLLPLVAWTFTKTGAQYLMWVSAFEVTVMAASMGLMLSKMGSVSPPYYIGYIHLCLVFSSVIQINFRVCSALILLNYLIFVGCAPRTGWTPDMVAAHFFLVASFFSCTIVNYVVERNRRLEFVEFQDKQKYYDQVQAFADQTKASLRRRNAVLNVLGHVVKTPLHQIIGYAQVIQQTARTSSDNDGVSEFADEIIRAGQTLTDQSQRILDYSRAEAGLLSVSKRTTTPMRLISEALPNFRNEAEEKRIELNVDVDDTPINADSGHLGRGLFEIIGNAVKYCPPGSKVEITSRQSAGRLVMSIHDNGPGIAEGQLDQASDALNKTEEFRNVGSDRLGIGISLANLLIKVSGGQLLFSSIPDVGSLAEITFPLDVPREDVGNPRQASSL